MQNLRSIQAMRGAAAMAVVIYHATQTRFGVGAAGVDLFFVISGFIMAQVSQGRERGEFIAARLWRILPLYFIALGAQLALFPVHWSQCRTLASLTMWPSWPNWCFPYVVQGWTLSYELLFYCLVALFIRRQWWLFIVLPTLILWRLILPTSPYLWLGNPLTLEFLMGVALVYAPRRFGLAALLVGLLALALAPVEPTSLLRVVYWGVPAALIFHGVLSFERLFQSGLTEPAVQLGNASYALYLFHIMIMRPLIGDPAVLSICAAVIGGYAIHRFVEKPILRGRRPIGALAGKLRNATFWKECPTSQTET